MTGPARLFLRSRQTGQPSATGVPACYRDDATDDGAACALAFMPDNQQQLVVAYPTCTCCRGGMNAAALFYREQKK